MSAYQISPFLRNAPLLSKTAAPNPNPFIYVFIYDHHYNWAEFQQYFPNSRTAGIASLPNWTWHINELQQPNIRRAYTENPSAHLTTRQYILPTPATHISIPRSPLLQTYGYILQLPRTSDAQLHAHLSHSSRIRMVQTVDIIVNTHPARWAKVSAIIYYDARNTSPCHHGIMRGQEEKDAWTLGLTLLRKSGVPYYYTQKVVKHLNGFLEDVEPLFEFPIQLENKGLDLGVREQERDYDVVFEMEKRNGNTAGGDKGRRAVVEEVLDDDERSSPLAAVSLRKRTVGNAQKRARNPCTGEVASSRPSKRSRKSSFGSAPRPRRGGGKLN